jgi:hypothetical protein
MGTYTSFVLEPIMIEDAKLWLAKEMGDSFVKGISVNVRKGYARVIVKTEGGESEIKISIPRRVVSK